MPCLTEKGLNKWLSSRGHAISESDPNWPRAEPVMQFYAPKTYQGTQCLVDTVLREVFEEGETLIVIDYAEPFDDCDQVIMEAMAKFLEGRHYNYFELPPNHFPSFKFKKSEWSRAVALFTLLSTFGWNCFLYGSNNQLTLFNWEGEIYDFWTDSEVKRKNMNRIIRTFALKRIRRRKSGHLVTTPESLAAKRPNMNSRG